MSELKFGEIRCVFAVEAYLAIPSIREDPKAAATRSGCPIARFATVAHFVETTEQMSRVRHSAGRRHSGNR